VAVPAATAISVVGLCLLSVMTFLLCKYGHHSGVLLRMARSCGFVNILQHFTLTLTLPRTFLLGGELPSTTTTTTTTSAIFEFPSSILLSPPMGANHKRVRPTCSDEDAGDHFAKKVKFGDVRNAFEVLGKPTVLKPLMKPREAQKAKSASITVWTNWFLLQDTF
jgi:hypothetical protein